MAPCIYLGRTIKYYAIVRSHFVKECSPVYLDYLDTIHPNQSPLKLLSSGLGITAD